MSINCSKKKHRKISNFYDAALCSVGTVGCFLCGLFSGPNGGGWHSISDLLVVTDCKVLIAQLFIKTKM